MGWLQHFATMARLGPDQEMGNVMPDLAIEGDAPRKACGTATAAWNWMNA
jgi:hypothetical protein